MQEPSDIQRQIEHLESEVERAARLESLGRTLEAIVDAVPDIIYRVDAEGRIVFISEAIRKYGFDPADLVGTSLFDLIHPDDRLRARFRVNERRTGERRTRSLELRLITGDRRSVPLELHETDTGGPTLLVDAEGVYATDAPRSTHFLYTQGVARDVSERRRVEACLEAARQEMARGLGDQARQIRLAYQQLRTQIEVRERREVEGQVLQRVRDEIWRMDEPDHLTRVVQALHAGLVQLGIDFHGLAVNLAETHDGGSGTVYQVRGAQHVGWAPGDDPEHARQIGEFIAGGVLAYRPDLHAKDPFRERWRIEGGWGVPVRSVVDAPFAGGTLAVNSRRPDAYTDADLELLRQMAAVLEGGLHRARDLRALQARTREAEGLAAERSAALDRELALGRIRARILAMRHLRDMPPEGFWVQELRRLGVPIGGISLQFPGSAPGTYVTYLFNEGSYSTDQDLEGAPWVRQVWESQETALVCPAHARPGFDWADITCILEVPLPGGGSLAVNRRDDGVFDESMVRTTVAFTGVVAEGVQRLRDFERLEESERRYRHLVEKLPIGVAHNTPDGRILYLNEYARTLFGYSADELSSLSSEALYVDPEDRERLALALLEHGVHSYEFQLRRKGGRSFWVRGTTSRVENPVSGRVEYHGFFEDITDRKVMEGEYARLEEQLRQAQKMEAVGQLTAGIAHNFNNMLQGISGNLQLAMLDAHGDLRQMLGDADRVTHRAAEMIRQLMVFARQGIQPVIRPTALEPIIANTIEICRRTFDRKIEIQGEPPQGLAIRGDPGALQQVLMNLLINARDAVEEADRPQPWIRIDACAVEVSPAEAAGRTGVRAGTFACVEVADNGVGMDEATRRRIYDPFFTTKAVDKGTGLGLATVYGIVTQHGGWITCDSRRGEGTTFRVYLPTDTTEAQASGVDAAATPDRGRATVLIVDDEQVVRESTARLLERKGLKVIVAGDGPSGLEALRRSAVDLVLLDLSMPGMSGRDVLVEVRRLRPDLRVLIFTGYTTSEAEVEGADGVVQKPFTVDELLAKIDGLLAG